MPKRVFELAKELEISANVLNDRVNELGIESKGNFTVLTEDQIKKVKTSLKSPENMAQSKAPSSLDGAKKIRRRISTKAPAETPKKLKKKKEIEEEAEAAIHQEEVAAEKKAKAAEEKLSEAFQEKTPEAVEEKTAPVVQEKTQPARAKEEAKPAVAAKKPEAKATAAPRHTPKPAAAKPSTARPAPKKPFTTPPAKKVENKADVRKKTAPAKKTHQPKSNLMRDFDRAAQEEKEIRTESEAPIFAPIVPDEPKPKKKEAAPVAAAPAPAQRQFTKKPAKWVKGGKYGHKQYGTRGKRDKNRPKHVFNARKKDLVVGESITVSDLASLIGVKANEIIKILMGMEMMVTVNQVIDGETAALVASEHGIDLVVDSTTIEDSIETIVDQEEDMQPRHPVVTIMGHVDHGKTSLLDKIRSANVTEGEAGGITQHIGAYMVNTPEGKIAFLDTPGHEAFTAMRARGANVTDMVILVVAADDGPRPQTVEAIHHAQAAEVPIIVAINKCDKPDAQPDRVVQQLMEHGLISEDFGGEIPMIPVSAHSGEGIPKLLEMISLQSEIMELSANPNRLAEGVVIESRVEKGKGNLATILVQAGTLKKGDNYVVGTQFGRVRAMWDDKGTELVEAHPSMPVEIVGLNGLPKSGDHFAVGPDERTVRQIAESRAAKEKDDKQTKAHQVTLENLFANAGKEEQKILNLIIKTDVVGSMEAISESLMKLGNEEVAVNVIHSAVGGVAKSDVVLAAASQAIVIGFNTRPDNSAKKLAQEENIEIRIYSVIYEAIEDVTKALEGMLKPIVREELQGRAEVLEPFNIPKVGMIAGSKVIDGKFVRDAPVRVIRDNIMIHDGLISSLKRFKENAKEVAAGFECGIGIKSYKDLKAGDILESYVRLETQATL